MQRLCILSGSCVARGRPRHSTDLYRELRRFMSSFSLLRPADPKHQAALLSVLRIVVGFLFFIHGTQKLFGFPADPNAPGPAHATVQLMSLFGLAGCIETFGGALICLG